MAQKCVKGQSEQFANLMRKSRQTLNSSKAQQTTPPTVKWARDFNLFTPLLPTNGSYLGAHIYYTIIIPLMACNVVMVRADTRTTTTFDPVDCNNFVLEDLLFCAPYCTHYSIRIRITLFQFDHATDSDDSPPCCILIYLIPIGSTPIRLITIANIPIDNSIWYLLGGCNFWCCRSKQSATDLIGI